MPAPDAVSDYRPDAPFEVEAVPGFLAPEERERLETLARAAARLGPCLEIGSYCGRSTVYLGRACRDRGSTLYAVDHHRGSEEHQPGEAYHDARLLDAASGRMDSFPTFRRTLEAAGLAETVVPIVAASASVARDWATPLGLVFIDEEHSAAAARADYRGRSPHLVSGGVLAIHDVFPDPIDGGRAPDEIYGQALASVRFEALTSVGSLAALRRR